MNSRASANPGQERKKGCLAFLSFFLQSSFGSLFRLSNFEYPFFFCPATVGGKLFRPITMISTKNISKLPNRDKLQKLCKSISAIEAIICEDWIDRYYSYNSKWSDQEEFCEMKNGQGDSMQILFHLNGCVINGMTHEFYPKDKSKLTEGLPKIYHDFIFGEPVHSIGTTFCIWTNNEDVWQTGELENFFDDSEELLKIFDDNPQTYIDWATDYYEDSFAVNENILKVVSDIYQGKVLSKSMVETINKDINHWQQLKNDLAEIHYPNNLS